MDVCSAERAFRELMKEAVMLGTVVVWLAAARDKRGLMMLGAFLLLVVFAVLAWNLAP
jgi:type II secretory pathway component PulM